MDRRLKRHASRNIGAFNGLYGASKIVNLSTTRKINNELKKSIHVCRECFIKYVKVKIILVAFPHKSQVASSISKQKVDIQTESSSESTEQLNNEILLSTLGSQMRITINPKLKEDVIFEAKKLDIFEVDTGASSNQMKIYLISFQVQLVNDPSLPKCL